MKIRVSLRYFVNDLWKHFFGFNLLRIPSNLITLNILLTVEPFTQFEPKIRAIKLQKSVKCCLSL